MPEDTAAPTAAPSSAGNNTNETPTPLAKESVSDNSTAGDFQPSWFSALDKAFTSEDAEPTPAEVETPSTAPDQSAETTEPMEGEDISEGKGDDDSIKNMTPSAGTKFKEIKAEAKAARARVAELEARLAEVEVAASPDAVETEKLQAAILEKESRIAEYEKELSISRFEATEEYRQSVVAPMAAILGVLEELAKDYDVPEKVLLNLLEEGDRKKQGDLITEVAANFSERDRFSLYQLGDDYAAILDHRDTLRSRAKEALFEREKSLNNENARKLEESRKQWGTSTKSVWGEFKKRIPLPNDPEARAAFESKISSQVSELNFDSLSTEHKAIAAFSGAVMPEIVQQNKSMSAEIVELKNALKKYQSATPGAGSGSDAKPQQVDSSLGFLEALEQRWAQG
jgi:hypothetical protein